LKNTLKKITKNKSNFKLSTIQVKYKNKENEKQFLTNLKRIQEELFLILRLLIKLMFRRKVEGFAREICVKRKETQVWYL